MKPKPLQRLWLDSSAEAPSGWLRCPATEAVRLLRLRKVKAVALGRPAAVALMVAQTLEQGAFCGSLPRCEVELRLPEGGERVLVQEALAAAERHWQSVPTKPLVTAPRPGPMSMIMRGIGLHLAGFIVVVGVFELFSLMIYGEHAAGVAWAIRQVRELVHPGK